MQVKGEIALLYLSLLVVALIACCTFDNARYFKGLSAETQIALIVLLLNLYWNYSEMIGNNVTVLFNFLAPR